MARERIFRRDDRDGLLGDLDVDQITDAFCDHWEDAKKGLEFMERFLKRDFVKAGLERLIDLGEAAYEEHCDDESDDAAPD